MSPDISDPKYSNLEAIKAGPDNLYGLEFPPGVVTSVQEDMFNGRIEGYKIVLETNGIRVPSDLINTLRDQYLVEGFFVTINVY